MLKKIRLYPYTDEIMANGEDIEVVHWVNINDQLKTIGQTVKEMAGDMVLLRRQFDQTQSNHDKLEYRVTQLEKKPEESRNRYTLYTLFGGCLYMLIQTGLSLLIAGATIYFTHH